jgi:hypothetical protein
MLAAAHGSLQSGKGGIGAPINKGSPWLAVWFLDSNSIPHALNASSSRRREPWELRGELLMLPKNLRVVVE